MCYHNTLVMGNCFCTAIKYACNIRKKKEEKTMIINSLLNCYEVKAKIVLDHQKTNKQINEKKETSNCCTIFIYRRMRQEKRVTIRILNYIARW